MTDEKCEQYRRQLGGMTRAHNKLKFESAKLRRRVKELEDENTELRKLVYGLYERYYDEWPDRAEEVFTDRLCKLGFEVRDE